MYSPILLRNSDDRDGKLVGRLKKKQKDDESDDEKPLLGKPMKEGACSKFEPGRSKRMSFEDSGPAFSTRTFLPPAPNRRQKGAPGARRGTSQKNQVHAPASALLLLTATPSRMEARPLQQRNVADTARATPMSKRLMN